MMLLCHHNKLTVLPFFTTTTTTTTTTTGKVILSRSWTAILEGYVVYKTASQLSTHQFIISKIPEKPLVQI